MKFLRFLLAILLPAVLIAAPQNRLEIISLKHRLPIEITSIIKPLLSPEDTLRTSGNYLILRTDERTLKEVITLLKDLDRPLKNLVITVRRRGKETKGSSRYAVSGQAGVGDNDRVLKSEEDASVKMHLRDRTYNNRADDSYRLRVIEGYHAFIQTGQLSPYPRGTTYVHPYGITRWGGFEFRDLTSGFDVVPYLNGDIVTLHIRPIRRVLRPGGNGDIDLENASTVISGRLGEWLTLGGKSQTIMHSAGGVIYRTARESRADSLTEIRVELAH